MKKLYSFIFISFILLCNSLSAAIVNITVSDNKFSPSTVSAVVGDSIVWTFSTANAHSSTTTTGLIPAAAAIWDSGVKTGPGVKFGYKLTVSGTFGYYCSLHTTAMVGTINVTIAGIIEPTTNLLTSVYPNPFNDKITIKYNGIESIEVFNMIGEKVKMMELSSSQNKTEIDFSHFPAGIYFYRTYKDGTLVETRKIIKAN